jgi:hypothetical protein
LYRVFLPFSPFHGAESWPPTAASCAWLLSLARCPSAQREQGVGAREGASTTQAPSKAEQGRSEGCRHAGLQWLRAPLPPSVRCSSRGGIEQEFPPLLSLSLRGGGRHYMKTHFGNRHRLPLVTGKALVTDQVLQMSQER